MMREVIQRCDAPGAPKKREITCLTCNLKGCKGHCRFQTSEADNQRKRAANVPTNERSEWHMFDGA